MIGLAGYVGDYDFTWNQFLLLFGVHLVWYVGILISTAAASAAVAGTHLSEYPGRPQRHHRDAVSDR